MNAQGQRGSLKRVGGQWVPTNYEELSVAPVEATDGAASVDNGDQAERPWKTATRAEWDDYARSQGVDPDEYSSKDALIEALG